MTSPRTLAPWTLALGLATAALADEPAPAPKADEPAAELAVPTAEIPPVAVVSDAEAIVRLKRTIEGDNRHLAEMKAELDDPDGEFAQAEAAFQELDPKLDDLKKRLEAAQAAGRDDEAKDLAAQLLEVEAGWKLSKDRFDLAIEERRTLKESIEALEADILRDQQALDRLTGATPATQATAAGTATTPAPATPASATPAAVTPSPAPAPPSASPAPAPAAPADAAAPTPAAPVASAAGDPAAAAPAAALPLTAAAPARPPSKELIAAEEDARTKAEIAREAETEAQSATERLQGLETSIGLEQRLLSNARKKRDNASDARDLLAEEFRTRSAEGAPRDEIRGLLGRLREAERRLREASTEVRQRTERLEVLHAERSELHAEQIAALEKARQAEGQVEIAQSRIATLQNPFAPRNVLRWLIEHGPKLLGIVLAMFLLQRLARIFSRRVVRLMAHGGMRGTKEEREDRANTLVGVFHNAVSVSIAVGGILMILQEAGIPIAPLLGGAAVFGLAVAFGAQNLIRDYFYGFVILLENQYKINDVVKIGDQSGQVERITLRMTVLRDLEGSVHFVPNGQVTAVTNLTHGWSRAVFDIGVAYKEDVDRVMALLVEMGRTLRQDPAFRSLILEDPTMLGVDAFGESAIVLKFYIKTRPLQQWTVKRELLRRIKNRFDELGIELPFPHRTLFHHIEGGSATLELQGPHARSRVEASRSTR